MGQGGIAKLPKRRASNGASSTTAQLPYLHLPPPLPIARRPPSPSSLTTSTSSTTSDAADEIAPFLHPTSSSLSPPAPQSRDWALSDRVFVRSPLRAEPALALQRRRLTAIAARSNPGPYQPDPHTLLALPRHHCLPHLPPGNPPALPTCLPKAPPPPASTPASTTLPIDSAV